jgi:hypothetical protein
VALQRASLIEIDFVRQVQLARIFEVLHFAFVTACIG